MDSVFAVARVGLDAAFSRLSVQSQNLSNVDTYGYKRQVPATTAFDARFDRIQLPGDGSVVSSSVSDMRAGVLKETGRNLDLALDGDGYFSIQAQGGTRFTRRGDFSMEATGRLVTSSGDAVMAGGGEIVLPNAAVTIDREGKIFDGDRQVAQLDVVHFADARRLQYVGNAQFDAAGQSPSADRSVTRVRSGYLETSNVQPAHEMIALLEVSRQVELARNVLTGRDEMLDSAANTLAQF